MSFSFLLTALAEYVGDVLVNDCGRPVPDRVLRYHGVIPADCCTDNGTLAVSWSSGIASQDFPSSAANAKAAPCSAVPLYVIEIRYRVCWPVPADVPGPTYDPTWDAAAAVLADVADCVTRALANLACAPPPGAHLDAFQTALLANVARGWLRFTDVAPIVPAGGCAGVLWRMSASPLPGPVS